MKSILILCVALGAATASADSLNCGRATGLALGHYLQTLIAASNTTKLQLVLDGLVAKNEDIISIRCSSFGQDGTQSRVTILTREDDCKRPYIVSIDGTVKPQHTGHCD